MIQQNLAEIISKKTSESQQRAADEEQEDEDVILIAIDHERCHEPELVRIGLNHGMDWYGTKYKNKYGYLNSLVQGKNGESSLGVYVKAIEALVEKALKRYEHPTNAELQQFTEIMLLDSCFIIESFHTHKMHTDGVVPYNNKNEENIIHILRHDLIRIGNQLPFFVLHQFFNTAQKQGKYPDDQLIDLARNFFQNMIGPCIIPSNKKIQHLLDLVYLTFSGGETSDSTNEIKKTELGYMYYASELQEVGVKFKKNEGEKKFFDIKFENGVMEIPPLSDNTLYLLRHLMAYEKQFPVNVSRPINDYVKFMQCLVDSPKDVILLRRSGIIDNKLGNDEVINRLNQLGSEAEISNEFTYSQLLNDVKEHCGSLRKVLMADLRRNYINSPWKFLSVLAALALLSLTVTQTVFAILSYTHPPQPKM